MSLPINISGPNMDITPALRSFTEEKFNRRFNRYLDYINRINVTFKVEKMRQIAEATINTTTEHPPLHASHESEDMYISVDGLVDKIERQMRKYKEKLVSQRS